MEKFANLFLFCFKKIFCRMGGHVFGISFLLGVVLIVFSGCATITVPKYIQDKNPYEAVLYGSYADALASVRAVLEVMGWDIMEAVEPSVYEHHRVLADPDRQQVLLFTSVREGAWVFGTRYHRMNVYLREITPQTTHLEIRYLTLSSIPMRATSSYRKDKLVARIIRAIEQSLKTLPAGLSS